MMQRRNGHRGRSAPLALLLCLAACLAAAPGCGLVLEGGAYAVYWYVTQEEEPEPQDPASLPAIGSGQVLSTGSLRADVEFRYQLADAQGDPAHVAAEYSTDAGASWIAAADAGGASHGLLDLAASPGGENHIFVWDVAADLPAASHWNRSVLFRLTPRDTATAEQGTAWTSLPFTVNRNTEPVATALTPAGPFPEQVRLQYILLDAESDAADVTVEYGLTETGPWTAAARVTGEGEDVTGLAASPSGTVHEFVWDCAQDLAGQANVAGVHLRLIPRDSAVPAFEGLAWISAGLSDVNYNSAPSVQGAPLTTVYNPATTVAVHYTLTDAESDPANITVEYQKDGAGPWLAAAEYTGTGSSSEGTSGLAASPAPGTDHVFEWDFSLVSGNDVTVALRVSIEDATFGNAIFSTPPAPWTSNSFQVKAVAGAHTSIVTVEDITGDRCDAVTVHYTLIDDFLGTGHPQNVLVKYSTDGGSTWLPASGSASEASWDPASEGLTSLSADPDGEDHVFVWDSFSDLGGQDRAGPPSGQGVRLRVISTEYGNYHGTSAFSLRNAWVATVRGGTASVLNAPAALAFDAAGNVFVCDTYNQRIQVLNAQASTQIFAGVSVPPNTLAVIAGTGTAGYNGDNIKALQALLHFPRGIAVDAASPPNIYFSDTLNHRVRRIDGSTGYITTVAGTGTAGLAGDAGLAILAELHTPQGLAFEGADRLWIADSGNNQIRLLNLGTSTLSAFGVSVPPACLCRISGREDGTADFKGDGRPFSATGPSGPHYDGPAGVAVDAAGNVYVADTSNHRIRAANAGASSITIAGVSVAAGAVQTVAGTGTAGFGGDGGAPLSADLHEPRALVTDASGHFFFADTANHRVRAVDAGSGTLVVGTVSFSAGTIETVTGGGSSTGDHVPGPSAMLSGPAGLALDGLSPRNLYVTDTGANRVRILNSDPSVTLTGVATDQGSTLAVDGGDIATVAGTAPAGLRLVEPCGTVLAGPVLYIADPAQHRVLALDLADRSLSVVAGTGQSGSTGDGGPAGSALLDAPRAVGVNGAGTVLLIADSGNDAVRAVNLSASSLAAYGQTIAAGAIETVSTAVGGGSALWVDTQNHAGAGADHAYCADPENLVVGRLATDGSYAVVAGSGSGYASGNEGNAALSFGMDEPSGVAGASDGTIYVADASAHRVYAFTLGSTMATVAGTGLTAFNGDNLAAASANLDEPAGLAVDGSDRLLLFDRGMHVIRRLASGTLTMVCGTLSGGYNGADKPPLNCQLNSPEHGAVDGAGNLYVTDTGNRLVRRFRP